MKKNINNNLIVNPELSKLIQALTSDEYQNLEKTIIDEGCRDSIVLWNKTIVDGHNRYEICTKHNIAFNTIQKDFENIEFAKEWIIINQFSRRNMSLYQRSSLALILKKIYENRAKEKEKIRKITAQTKAVDIDDFTPSQKEIVDVLKEYKKQTKTTPDKIYFVQNDDKIKIESTSDVDEKIKEITKYLPEAKLIGVCDGDATLEKSIHKAIERDKIDNEWFKLNATTVSIIKAFVPEADFPDVRKVQIDSTKEAATKSGVSQDAISKVKKIETEADDKIKNKLKSGEMSINQAYKEIKADDKSIKLKEKKAEYTKQYIGKLKVIPEVYLMDCKDFLQTFEDNSIDLLYTDPPFMTDVPDIKAFTESWLPLAIQKTKKSGRMLIFSGAYPEEMEVFLKILRSQDKFIVDNPLVWIFNNTLGVTPKMNYDLNYQFIWHLYSNESPELDTSVTKDMFSAQVENAPDGRLGNRLHKWQKSDKLAIKHITQTTKETEETEETKEKKLVVDPFTCTGTFLIAAGRLGRIGKGCDIDQTNLNIAISRGCKLMNKAEDTTSIEELSSCEPTIDAVEPDTTASIETTHSINISGGIEKDDLLQIVGDEEEVDKNLSTAQITENTSLEAQPSNVGFKKRMVKNRNLHKVNRKEIKKMFQAKN